MWSSIQKRRPAEGVGNAQDSSHQAPEAFISRDRDTHIIHVSLIYTPDTAHSTLERGIDLVVLRFTFTFIRLDVKAIKSCCDGDAATFL